MARNAVIVAATVAVAELTPGVQPRRGVLAAVHCGRHARHAPASIGVRFRSCSNGRTATASSRVLPVSLRAYNRCRGKGRQRRRRWSDSTRAPPSRQLDASAPRETARSRDRARMPRQGDRPAPRQSVGAEHENVDPFQPVRPAGARPAVDELHLADRLSRSEPHRPRGPGPRVPWAELLSRVFNVDVLECENCGGRLTVLAFLTERTVVTKILEHLGLPATGPPKAPARRAAQLELDEHRLTSCGT